MKKEKVEKLAEEHWKFLEELFKLNFVSTCSIVAAGYLYKQAFIHGFKHGKEEEGCRPCWEVCPEQNKKLIGEHIKMHKSYVGVGKEED